MEGIGEALVPGVDDVVVAVDVTGGRPVVDGRKVAAVVEEPVVTAG